MEATQFFLDQQQVVRAIVDGMVLGSLSDDQLRHCPGEGQNSLAWLLWHAARMEDFAVTVLDAKRPQVLHQNYWLKWLNLSRRDVGTGMTADECAHFNATVDIVGLRAYWEAVGRRTREVAGSLRPEELDEPVDESRLGQTSGDGVIGNERARWLEQFFAGRTKAWFLSFVTWHHAEHLFGEALCVRSQSGIALGL
jgi:hypothetical protein